MSWFHPAAKRDTGNAIHQAHRAEASQAQPRATFPEGEEDLQYFTTIKNVPNDVMKEMERKFAK